MLLPLVIAAAICAVAYFLFRDRFHIVEYIGIIGTALIVYGLLSLIYNNTKKMDTEYLNSTLDYVIYYEYYETWVEQMCPYDCNCTTDDDGYTSCDTCWEDCSYCDRNYPYWRSVSRGPDKREMISEERYLELKRQFGTNEFEDLNRNINYRGSCGEDGDAWISMWDGNPQTYEPFIWTQRYENKVRLSNEFKRLSKEEQQRVLKYPKVKEAYAPSIIGRGNWQDKGDFDKALHNLDRFNGQNGKNLQIRVWMFVYPDSITRSDFFLQKHYFQGGNKNEIIIGVGKDWVDAFSWTAKAICYNETRRYYVDNKEDFTLVGLVDHMVPIWKSKWERKEFTPLNELIQINQPGWFIGLNIFITLGACIILFILFIKNDYEH